MIDKSIFNTDVQFNGNIINIKQEVSPNNQQQTSEAFSEKWTQYETSNEKNKVYDMQKQWYLKLYGFKSEDCLANFLKTKKYILDAGCGLGYKAKWFADLSPNSIVIAMDISDACEIAAKNYKDTKNLFFIRGDIANTPFIDNSIDYVSCDQVIMHTQVPENTFKELVRVMKQDGEFSCYVYVKKALPRELLDEHFRSYCKTLTNDELWDMSNKLAQLGKTLQDLEIKINVPDIPQMDIKGGEYDLQRFIYWNFIKCFWNDDLGLDASIMTNFDWYSPSNAKRYSEVEYKKMINDNSLAIKHFHKEEACYSGRFHK